jgi:endonuclease/exonuclease/phosphatase family metal-dependent hydrolase
MRRFIAYLLYCILPLALSSLLVGEELRIATYNLNNYLVMDRQVGARWRPSYPKPEAEKLIVRQVICETFPDVLVLQELGGVDFLEELRADLARDGLCYQYAVHLDAADSDRHIAVLSRLAPKNVIKHTDLEFKYFESREFVKRGMLELVFEFGDGETFQLFAVHLKSHYTDNKADLGSEMRRVREAEACRNKIIDRTHEQGTHHYLIVGDFNDHPASASLRRFYRRGTLAIGDYVLAADSRGEMWTHFFEKELTYESVDGFVASPSIMPRIKTGRAHIVDSIGSLNGSDHRMVYLDLN